MLCGLLLLTLMLVRAGSRAFGNASKEISDTRGCAPGGAPADGSGIEAVPLSRSCVTLRYGTGLDRWCADAPVQHRGRKKAMGTRPQLRMRTIGMARDTCSVNNCTAPAERKQEPEHRMQ